MNEPDNDQELLSGLVNPWENIKKALECLKPYLKTHDPVTIAESARALALRRSDAQKHVTDLIKGNPHSATAKELYRIDTNTRNAAHKLASIGYQRLRALRAHGLTFSEISKDLGINVNDIIEFMRLSPTALMDAEQDEESCADSRTHALADYVRTEPILNKNDVIRLQLQTNIQLEMNKRLSSKWAQGNLRGTPYESAAMQKDALKEQQNIATITMVINAPEETEQPKIINADPDYDSKQAEETKIEPEFSMGLPGGH